MSTPTIESDSALTRANFLFWLAVTMMVVTAGAYLVRFSGAGFSTDPSRWGVLGDYFGGTLGPTFNLITLYMLVTNLKLQITEMTAARADAAAARVEAAAAERALRAQYDTVQLQSFEQTFFSWLRSYRSIVDNIALPTGSGPQALYTIWTGTMNQSTLLKDAQQRFGLLNSTVMSRLYVTPPVLSDSDRKIADSIVRSYEDIYGANKYLLDTMFRTLYRLIRWIDESEISVWKKFNYVGIVRSQVSAIELDYLFINGLTARGAKFLPLIERYALLDNMESSYEVFEILKKEGANGARYSRFAFDSSAARAFIATAISPCI